MSDMRLTVVGAAGRMGRTLIRVIAETSGVELAHAIEQPGNDAVGADAGELAGLSASGVTVTDDALTAIAEKARRRKTGARARRGVLDEIMFDLMFELPDTDNAGVQYVITREVIESNAPTLAELRVERKESA